MNSRNYFIKTFLFLILACPFLISFVMLPFWGGLSYMPPMMAGIPAAITALLYGWLLYEHTKKAALPESFWKRYAPVFLPFFYYMGIWVLTYGLFDYYPSVAQSLLSLPYYYTISFLNCIGEYDFYPVILAAIFLACGFALWLAGRLRKQPLANKKGWWIAVAAAVGLFAIGGVQHHTKYMQQQAEEKVQAVQEELDLAQYKPFAEDSKLEVLENPTLAIYDNYPKLDGATAAYPVYGAMAQAVYKGLDAGSIGEYVQCNRTNEAYGRLISGEADIFFGAQPSKGQMEAAAEAGMELQLTPIGKEAFVFFVNRYNPVDNLTVEQIQEIYQDKITNWSELGGQDFNIEDMQRNEGSGSQTVMEAVVMEGKELPEPGYGAPLSMSLAIEDVAKHTSAIGYSFRYYATEMDADEGIKLLAVNGVEPTRENIASGAYPFTVDVYAVTAGTQNKNAQKLINWILSAQGQDFVEQCGYTRIQGK